MVGLLRPTLPIPQTRQQLEMLTATKACFTHQIVNPLPLLVFILVHTPYRGQEQRPHVQSIIRHLIRQS
ncbi:MAG: hypothetical protein COW30_00205 [Rhodospirillales bacterium CG15_BIG_FIL_POST_REV_8_21_14_020_66_15]|nr:MAG: hypothetical protein COW30_00205 [Rhodospirillales bacterium CG15_BIG_FIL_POST_REV_8_21_14_020_66_15]